MLREYQDADIERLEGIVTALRDDLVGSKRWEGDKGRVGKLEDHQQQNSEDIRDLKSFKRTITSIPVRILIGVQTLVGLLTIYVLAKGIVK